MASVCKGSFAARSVFKVLVCQGIVTGVSGSLRGGSDCSADSQECTDSKCCSGLGFQCYAKNDDFAQCRSSCTLGVHSDDDPEHRDAWSCTLAPSSDPAPAPALEARWHWPWQPEPSPAPPTPTPVHAPAPGHAPAPVHAPAPPPPAPAPAPPPVPTKVAAAKTMAAASSWRRVATGLVGVKAEAAEEPHAAPAASAAAAAVAQWEVVADAAEGVAADSAEEPVVRRACSLQPNRFVSQDSQFAFGRAGSLQPTQFVSQGSQFGSRGSSMGEDSRELVQLQTFAKGVLETVAAHRASIEKQLPHASAVEAPSQQFSTDMNAVEHQWHYIQGYLLPVAHAGRKSDTSTGQPQHSGACLAALRHRVWLRRAHLSEQSKLDAALVMEAALGAQYQAQAAQARSRAADVLQCLLASPDLKRSVASTCTEVEERQLASLKTLGSLKMPYRPPAGNLRRDIVRLEGAEEFLKFLQQHDDGLSEVDAMLSKVAALRGELEARAEASSAEQARFEACVEEVLVADAVLGALAPMVRGKRPCSRNALLEAADAISGVAGSAVAEIAEADFASDILRLQELRWRHLEGALVVQRVLAREGGLQVELWLHQVRQLHGAVRKSFLSPMLEPAGTKGTARKPHPHPQTRLRVLAALAELLGEATAEQQAALESILPKVSSSLSSRGPSSGGNAGAAAAQDPEAALATLREARFGFRAHAAAVATASALGPAEGGALAERLHGDLERARKALAAAEAAPAVRQHQSAKWEKVAQAVLAEVKASRGTVAEALAVARAKLGEAMRSALVSPGSSTSSSSTSGPHIFMDGQMVLDVPVHDSIDAAPWSCLGGGTARHAQIAHAAGSLWALELARKGAGAPNVSESTFRLLKRCVELNVDARFLEVLAEMLLAGQVPELSPPGTASSRPGSMKDRRSAGAKVAVRREAFGSTGAEAIGFVEDAFAACCYTDFGTLADRLAADADLLSVGSFLSKLQSTLEQECEVEGGKHGGEDMSEAPKSTFAAIPPISSWWRSASPSADWASERLLSEIDGSSCSVASLLLSGQQSGQKNADTCTKHAAAMRLWLFARAQRALTSALTQRTTPHSMLLVHLKRSLRRFLEIGWVRDFQVTELLAHNQARCAALERVAAFIGPLSSQDAELVEVDELELHADEVRQSLVRTLEAEPMGMLGGLAAACGASQLGAVEEGAQACAVDLKDAGGNISAHAAVVNQATKTMFPQVVSSSALDVAPFSDGCYLAKLCGTLRSLELLQRASPHLGDGAVALLSSKPT
mmetsp:Transcript_68443/g.196338  ORF Transcript_68443/g.196338 Transcript_68443/m.196338 type:complete len:1274 (+) Transcript_68443:68-3889(+)